MVVDVGEHLSNLGLFLFQTSDIQHKYSKFRDFQVICAYRDIEYILKIFWTSSNISSSVKQSYLDFKISKRGVLYMVGNIKKLSTTFIQNTCLDSVVSLLKNRNRTETISRFQTTQKLYLETEISHKPDQI